MDNLRKAAEMALKALEGNCTNPVADPEQAQEEDRAIQALRQALAQPEQEPVNNQYQKPFSYGQLMSTPTGNHSMRPQSTSFNAYWLEPGAVVPVNIETTATLIKEIQRLRQNETPPCKTDPQAPHGFDRNASHSADRYVCECEGWEPPKREWVGLTEKDIYEIIETNIPPKLTSLFDMAEWVSKIIETKLKEKNGG